MRMLITAGPTREPIDAVRFISNRSSGRMGMLLAEAAAAAGHEVMLLLGPVASNVPLLERMQVDRFETSAELATLLAGYFPDCRVLVMAAAVSDYRPVTTDAGKLPRREAGAMTLELQPTPDLVAQLAAAKRPGQRIVAFALEEPAHLEVRAQEKLRRKGVDAIVANPLKTMESPDIEGLWLTAAGERESPGRLSKAEFAHWLIHRIERLAGAGKA